MNQIPPSERKPSDRTFRLSCMGGACGCAFTAPRRCPCPDCLPTLGGEPDSLAKVSDLANVQGALREAWHRTIAVELQAEISSSRALDEAEAAHSAANTGLVLGIAALALAYGVWCYVTDLEMRVLTLEDAARALKGLRN